MKNPLALMTTTANVSLAQPIAEDTLAEALRTGRIPDDQLAAVSLALTESSVAVVAGVVCQLDLDPGVLLALGTHIGGLPPRTAQWLNESLKHPAG